MKTYHIIDKREKNVRSELKHYTFEELKDFFEPDKNEFPEFHKEWEEISDLWDLEQYLKEEADGMEQPYSFEEDEVENIDSMERANNYYKRVHIK